MKISNRLFRVGLILVLLVSPCHAREVIEKLDDAGLVQLNEELRRIDKNATAGVAGGESTTVSDTTTLDLTLTGVAIKGDVILLKDLVTTAPLSGGTNDILVGADSDITLSIDNISYTLLADGTDGNLITWDAAGAPALVATGNAGEVLTSNGAGAAPTFQAAGGGGGKLLQMVNYTTGSYSTGATTIPYDNTKPQNTEGDEYMRCAITPSNANHHLLIEVTWIGSSSANSIIHIVALFQDNGADALAAAASWITALSCATTVSFSYYMLAGTTSETTFKVRAGGHMAGTTYFNGASGAGIFNGTCASSITISEIDT